MCAVRMVADAPALTVADASGAEDSAISLSINPALTADDKSDVQPSLHIVCILSVATLSNTNGDTLTVANDGRISFTADDLVIGVLGGFEITPLPAVEAAFARRVTPTTPFFFNDTATAEIYTLSLHDALPIVADAPALTVADASGAEDSAISLSINPARSEERRVGKERRSRWTPYH